MSKHKKHKRSHETTRGISAFGIYGMGGYWGGYPGYGLGGTAQSAPLNPDQFSGMPTTGDAGAAPSGDAGGGTV